MKKENTPYLNLLLNVYLLLLVLHLYLPLPNAQYKQGKRIPRENAREIRKRE
jgi:hypothetical protein